MPPRTARFALDPAFAVGEVDPRLFGSLCRASRPLCLHRHLRARPPRRDAEGLRQDVLDLVRELGTTAIRYPGGNFVSGYQVGGQRRPQGRAPRRLDLAWRSTETNRFGLSEYIDFLRKVGGEPLLAVNLGTRGVQEALELQGVRQPPGRHRTVGPARLARRQGPLRHPPVVPRQRGRRRLADRPQDRRGVRPARRRDRRAMRQQDWREDLKLVACGSSARAWRPSPPGSPRSCSTRTTWWTTSPCTRTTRSTTATATPSWRRRWTWSPSSRTSWPPATTSAPG